MMALAGLWSLFLLLWFVPVLMLSMAVRAPAEDRAAVITTPTQAPMWTNHWLKAAARRMRWLATRAWEKGATPSRQSTATRVVPWICRGPERTTRRCRSGKVIWSTDSRPHSRSRWGVRLKSRVAITGEIRWAIMVCREGRMEGWRVYRSTNIPTSSRSTAQNTASLALIPGGRAMPWRLIKSLLPTRICWSWHWPMRPVSCMTILSMGR